MPSIHEAALEAVKHRTGAIGRPPDRIVVILPTRGLRRLPTRPGARLQLFEASLTDLLSVDWVGGPVDFVANWLQQQAEAR